MNQTSTDDQFAARALVRDWAAGAGTTAVIREVEQGEPDAWRQVFARLADLGLFGVAVPEDCGGAGGSVEDLCAMVDEAARALVPGPVATTALAALVVDDPKLRAAFAAGERTAGTAIHADLHFDPATSQVSGTAPRVLGATDDAVLLLPADQNWLLVDLANTDGGAARIEPLPATDFSRTLARVELNSAPAVLLEPAGRIESLAATLLSAEAAGITRWALDTAVGYAKVREQFGKPIGSFQAVKHLCAEMLCRAELAAVAAGDAARAAADPDDQQFAIAAAVAAGTCIDAAKANVKDCIQVLGGIGITWEHDAHLYLRRAYGIGQFLGGSQRWLRRTAVLTQAGVRRNLDIDLSALDDTAGVRAEIAATAARIAALPKQQRQVALAEAGLLAPHWPVPYGRGAGPAEQLVIDQELAAAGVERPDLVVGWWAAPTILEHGTPEQIERFILPTLRGDVFWCQLFSEPGAGSDLASLRTKAVRVDGGWRLTGQKVWTSRAHDSQWGVCLARTNPDAPKHKGITYFLVDMAAPGIDIRPLREITGAALFNEVFLDDVFVPDAMVVGGVNDGWRLARTTLSNERVAMAHGTALGNPMEQLLETVRSMDLDVAGQDRLAGLIIAAQVGSLLDQRIAQLLVGGKDPGAESSVRKLIGVRYRQELAEYRMDITDDAGAVIGECVHDFLNTRCLTIAGGTEQILLTVAAERLLGLPRG
ncbi:MAG TPA: acyl-CoA dehydrogenase [Mycobacterium sp.]|nr:acyl-CoA dehydrogenase [Mycobacterium sp.]